MIITGQAPDQRILPALASYRPRVGGWECESCPFHRQQTERLSNSATSPNLQSSAFTTGLCIPRVVQEDIQITRKQNCTFSYKVKQMDGVLSSETPLSWLKCRILLCNSLHCFMVWQIYHGYNIQGTHWPEFKTRRTYSGQFYL